MKKADKTLWCSEIPAYSNIWPATLQIPYQYLGDAQTLFARYCIDGESQKYMQSDRAFGIIVAGSSPLTIETVRQICELAHLPNENHVTLYCVDKDIETFKKSVQDQYSQIEKIPTITIEYLALDMHVQSNYMDTVWDRELTHVILAYKETKQNMDIATKLMKRTYPEQAQSRSTYPMIHIALCKDQIITAKIDTKKRVWHYCDAFTSTNEVVNKKNSITDRRVALAKRIHAGYRERYMPDMTYSDHAEIEDKWQQIENINDHASSIAQADHLPLKLKAMGLVSVSSEKPQEELLAHNRTMLNRAIGDELEYLGLDDATMIERTKNYDRWEDIASFNYFPTSYETLVEKLILAEHNRWNAYHYLRGWIHNAEQTHKPTKEHRCLIPMAEMDERDRFTVLYDLYAILYIPNLLASIGQKIQERVDG